MVHDKSGDEGCYKAYRPVLDALLKDSTGLELMDVRVRKYMDLYDFFCSHPKLCLVGDILWNLSIEYVQNANGVVTYSQVFSPPLPRTLVTTR